MTQIPHPYNLGDKGVISSDLQKKKRIPGHLLDSVSQNSEALPMGGMAEEKARSDWNAVLCRSVSNHRHSCRLYFRD